MMRKAQEEDSEVLLDAKEVWTDDEGWSRPVIFFPNGQSTGGQIYLLQNPNFTVDLQLRSLTGDATVGQIQKLKPEEVEAYQATEEDFEFDSDELPAAETTMRKSKRSWR
ncbi:MAG: hypothetical protein R3C11_23625 [Planctomycetaceae bacterium]